MKTNYSNMNMLDMIFEHRNKDYGAYALRRDYNKSLAKAMGITAALVLLLIGGGAVSQKMQAPPKTIKLNKFTDVNTSNVIIDHQKKTEKPLEQIHHEQQKPKITPPPKVTQPAVNTAKITEMKVVKDIQATDTLPTMQQLLTAQPDVATNNVKGDAPVENITEFKVGGANRMDPINFADKNPEYPGGEKALMAFLRNETQYPSLENETGIQGKTIVRFVVNEDGSISDATILRSESPGFSKEALRVVGRLKKFKPGIQANHPVRVWYTLPFCWIQQ